MKYKNILHVKEVALSAAFLILLFLLSYRALGKTKELNEAPKSHISHIYEAKAISAGHSLKISNAGFLNIKTGGVQTCIIRLESKKLETRICDFLKNNRFLKPPVSCRLYYRFFTLKSEEPPLLG